MDKGHHSLEKTLLATLRRQLFLVRRMERMVAHRHHVYGLPTAAWCMMYLSSTLFFHSTFLKFQVSVHTSLLVAGVLNAVAIFIIFKSHRRIAANQWESDFKRAFLDYQEKALNTAAVHYLNQFIHEGDALTPENARIWCCAEVMSLNDEINKLRIQRGSV